VGLEDEPVMLVQILAALLLALGSALIFRALREIDGDAQPLARRRGRAGDQRDRSELDRAA
jgi:hypothetical protein